MRHTQTGRTAAGSAPGTTDETRPPADEALRESERRYRSFVEASAQVVWTVDARGEVDRPIPAWERYTGQTFAETKGLGWMDAICPADRPAVAEAWRRAVADGATYEVEYALRRSDGAWRTVLARGVPVRDEAGRVVEWIGACADIQDRRAAEATLSAVLDALPVGVIIADAKGRIVRDNAANRELWGVPPETTDWAEYGKWVGYWPDTGQRIEAHEWGMARALLRGEVVKGELVECEQFGTGRRRFFLNNAAPVRDAAGNIIGGVAAEHDVTERRAAEQALRDSESRFRALVEATPALLFETDAAGQNIYVNQRFEEYTGLSNAELMGDGWLRVLHPDDRARAAETWMAAVASGGVYEIEYRFLGRDSSYRWFLGRGAPLRDAAGAIRRWVGTCTDIQGAKHAAELLARHRDELERLVEERTAALMRSVEERRRAEDAARQAEKLAALGQLTGGVAHDINNILQVVTSGAALLKRPAVADARRAAILEGMIQAGQKARDLTGRLLAFARRQPLKPEAFDVAERLEGMSELLRQTLGPSVAVATDIPPGLWRPHADPSQLEVAVLNLALNARDAMPDGGILTVRARNVALSASAERAAGEYVCISAKDTGQGIPPHLLGRIFEPFFSTKKAGMGTGLGLSQVHGFVTQSGGDIHVESEPGRGTTVFFHLPRAAAEAEPAASPAPRPPAGARNPSDAEEPSVVHGVGKLVLVVDDNADVAALACSLLEGLGYATERAASGAEALAVLEGGAPVDAVFSDVVMPGGISGLELAAALRSSRPGVAVVLATGYSELLARGGAPEGVETLRKPYRVGEVAATLDRALARGRARAEAAG